MLEHLDQLVPIVLDSLQDPHPRVRWVAADLIRVLSMKLAPTFHEQCHHRILPLLTTLIEDQDLSVQVSAFRFRLNYVIARDHHAAMSFSFPHLFNLRNIFVLHVK